MSTRFDLEKQSISSRLVEDRKRLGISQSAAQVAAGCGRQAWIDKEAGRSDLKAGELIRLEQAGFDVYWILTGEHTASGLAPHESLLIEVYRDMNQSQKAMLLGAALGAVHPTRIPGWLEGGTDAEGATPETTQQVTYLHPGNPRRNTVQESAEKSGKDD